MKICFVSPYCYPLFNPAFSGQFGGAEVRAAQLARGLARKGNLEVSILVFDHGQLSIPNVDDVVLRAWKERPTPSLQKLTQLRTFHGYIRYLLTVADPFNVFVGDIHRVLRKFLVATFPIETSVAYLLRSEIDASYDGIDADVFVSLGNNIYASELAYFCRSRNSRHLFVASSDLDYAPDYKMHPRRRDLYGSLYGMKAYAIEKADHHVVQNQRQAELLRRYYGRSSTLIRNPIDLQPVYPRHSTPRTVLWVGKSDERVKQPSAVVSLARTLPEYEFIMIMPLTVQETHERILSEAEKLPNLTVIEGVPFDEVEKYFAAARLHINTSRFEGFPNTFLQAAKYGVPTLSLSVDPDGMLSRQGCGTVCEGDVNRMRDEIRRYMGDDTLCAQVGERAQRYVREHHDMEIIIPQYMELFSSLMSGGKSPKNV